MQAVFCKAGRSTAKALLENEHEHFWKMVWETKTTAIIMLTDLVEGGYEKCSWYLPSEKGETLPSNGELTQEEVIIVNQIDGPPKPTEESSRGSTKLVERGYRIGI